MPSPGISPDGSFARRLRSVIAILCRPTDGASVAFLRFAFGTVLTWEVCRYFRNGWIDSIYALPPFHFTYAGFGWVRPLPGFGMHFVFFLLGVSGVLVAVGLFYRVSSVILLLGWTYVFLIDQAAYLNHLYLVLLVAALLTVIPAHCEYSIDSRHGRRPPVGSMPQWALWGARLQIAIPYFYGGIAKLNADWFQGQPMQIWMSRMTMIRGHIPWFGERWAAVAASYVGCIFDLLVVPLLLWRRTRPLAYLAAVLFHLANAAMFHIGIFPWFMILATTIFFSPDWPRKVLRRFRRIPRLPEQHFPPPDEITRPSITTNIRLVLVGLLFLLELLVPFRHHFYSGRVDWTESGYRFSWRMMLKDKPAAISMVVRDRSTGRTHPVQLRKHLTEQQLTVMSGNPWMIRQFAREIRKEIDPRNTGTIEVRAIVLCSLNGRKPQFLIDPRVNLAEDKLDEWIVPLHESLPEAPWSRPQRDWLKSVDFEFADDRK